MIPLSIVSNNLEILKLDKMKEDLPILLESGKFDPKQTIEVLSLLTEAEIKFKNQRAKYHLERRLTYV